MAKVVIIGAGISGLAVAHWVQRQGHETVVLEKSRRAGGVIETIRGEGYLFEKGPNSFLDNVPEMTALCSELELENEILKQSLRDNKRYIFLKGKLHNVPMGPSGLFKTELLSGKSKRKLFTEAFRKGNRSPEDESLAAFIRRRFGEEILRNLVTPFVSGVYAGDPEQLSLRGTFPLLYELERNHGSLTWGMISRLFKKKKNETPSTPKKGRAQNLCSFVDGMSALTNALANNLKGSIRYGVEAHEIQIKPTGGFTVHCRGSEPQTVEGEVLVPAIPAYSAAEIAASLLPDSCAYLRSIPHNRLAVLGLGYRREAVAHDCSGFGFLAPRGEGARILGSIWNSSLFARRAPSGVKSFSVFIGGGLDPEAYDLSDDELLRQAQADLKITLGIEGSPARQEIFRWEKAIPQYPIGHVEKIEALNREQARIPGLFITGNYLDGVSTNDCIRNAKRTAEAIHEFLKNRR